MGFLIGLLTVVMVVDCIVLMFLVLIQLPKKEAGAGLAFGGAATDALFGAGSGTVLTKITKYAATIFFALAVVLSVMQRYYHTRSSGGFMKAIGGSASAPGIPGAAPQATAPPSTPPSSVSAPAATSGSNALTLEIPSAESTNLPLPIAPAPAPTNAPK